MRLVCERCDAAYSIEDGLVGQRDFSVSCKRCGTPIIVRKAKQLSSRPPPKPSAKSSFASLGLPSKADPPVGNEAWYVSVAGAQEGPFTAAEVARLFEQERMSWASSVWRSGLRDWRPARRDPLLVTAVAGARGFAGDTMRLGTSARPLANDDTIVDYAPAPVVSEIESENLTHSSDEKTIAHDPGLPLPLPIVHPVSWSSPLPPGAPALAEVGKAEPQPRPEEKPKAEKPKADPASSPALRDAMSLTEQMPIKPDISPPSYHPPPTSSSLRYESRSPSWFPRSRSVLVVGVAAFVGGVAAAALLGRMLSVQRSEPPVAQPLLVAAAEAPTPSAGAGAKAPPRSAPSEPAPAMPPPAPSEIVKSVAEPAVEAESESGEHSPLRELPGPDELRAAVRGVAPAVRECLAQTSAGLEVDIFLQGPTGKVRAVVPRSVLNAARTECVTRAISELRLAPFARPELKLRHRFSW